MSRTPGLCLRARPPSRGMGSAAASGAASDRSPGRRSRRRRELERASPEPRARLLVRGRTFVKSRSARRGLVTHHGQQAAEVAFPERCSCLLFLGFPRLLNSCRPWGFRTLWHPGGPASIWRKASAQAIWAPREPEHRHRDGQWSLHYPHARQRG